MPMSREDVSIGVVRWPSGGVASKPCDVRRRVALAASSPRFQMSRVRVGVADVFDGSVGCKQEGQMV